MTGGWERVKNNYISGRSSSGVPWWQIDKSSSAFWDGSAGPFESIEELEGIGLNGDGAEELGKGKMMPPAPEPKREEIKEKGAREEEERQLKVWCGKEAAGEILFLRYLLLKKLKKACYYRGMAKLLAKEKGEVFSQWAGSETGDSKLVLGLLGRLDPVQKCELEALHMQKVLEAAEELCSESLDLLGKHCVEKGEEEEFFKKIASRLEGEKKTKRRQRECEEEGKKDSRGLRSHLREQPAAEWEQCLWRGLAMTVETIDFCEKHYECTQGREIKRLLEHLLHKEKHHLALLSRYLLSFGPDDP